MIRTLLVLSLVTACSKKAEPADNAAPPPGDPPGATAPAAPAGSGSAASPGSAAVPSTPPEEPAKQNPACIVPATFEAIESEGADIFLTAAGKEAKAPKGATSATLRLPRPHNLSRAYLTVVGELKAGTFPLVAPDEDPKGKCATEGCAYFQVLFEGATQRASSVSGTLILDVVDARQAVGHVANAKVVEEGKPTCAMVVEKLSFELDLSRAMTY